MNANVGGKAERHALAGVQGWAWWAFLQGTSASSSTEVKHGHRRRIWGPHKSILLQKETRGQEKGSSLAAQKGQCYSAMASTILRTGNVESKMWQIFLFFFHTGIWELELPGRQSRERVGHPK